MPDADEENLRHISRSIAYPWTVIRVEDRDEYLRALDRASIDLDIAPFAKYVAGRVKWSIQKATKAGTRSPLK